MATKYLDYEGLTLYTTQFKTWCNNTFAPKSHTHGNINNDGTITSGASKVVVTDSSGKITVSSDIDVTVLGHLNGVKSNIQSQLDDKAASSHGTHVTYGTANPSANGTAAPGTADSVSRSDHVHPLQTTVSGLAGTATKLATARTIDGVDFDGTAAIAHYGTCSTAAGTAAKVVALTSYKLVTGSKVVVKFTATNTAANPTLNVNSTGAKSIVYRGSAISAGSLAANRVYEFVYDGTNYELIGDLDTNTTYSAERGITLSSGKFGHTNAVTATTLVGGSANETPAYNATFSVPYFSFDAQGHITAAGTKTVKIPSSDNVDTKVTQSKTTTSSAFPIILGAASTVSGTDTTAGVGYSTGITANPSTGEVTATTFSGAFSGDLTGTAAYATSAGSASTANTATYTSGTAAYATSADSASTANTATYTSGTAAYATKAGTADSATDPTKLPLAGGTMSGNIVMRNSTVTLVGTASYASNAGSAGTSNTATYTKGTSVYAQNAPWSGISSKPTTLSGYGITDAYTKTEIDTKLTSAMKYKGSVKYYSILSNTTVASGKTSITINGTATQLSVGDFYNVLYEGTSGTVEDGSNYAWTGTTWDKVGFAVNFPAITNTEIQALFTA